jgi:hypothetical protein
MFKLFKKRSEKPSIVHSVLDKMTRASESRQRKAADYLNEKISVLSIRQLKIGFVIFSLLFAAGCCYVIWDAFSTPALSIHIDPITIPKHTSPRDSQQPVEKLLSEQEFNEIESFEKWLDSLQATPSGKLIYDSIAHDRPGLLDSLAFIQQLFHKQFKSK